MRRRIKAGAAGRMAVILALALGAVAARAAELSATDKAAVDQANKFCQRGADFVQKDSLQRAKSEYLKALKVFPRHLDALYNLGVVCERLHERDEAIGHYRHYLELSPQEADVWNQLGVLSDEAGKPQEAMAAYEKALQIDPGYGRAHHNLGILSKEQGRPAEAREHLEKFVQLEEAAGRRNGDAYYSLGVFHLEQLQVRDAKLLLQKAVDTDPSSPLYNNALGDAYLLEQQPDLAIGCYHKALEKDPKYAPAYSGLGDARRLKNEIDQAAKAYRKALEISPDYAVVQYKIALMVETNDAPQAIRCLENYLRSGNHLRYQKDAAARLEKLKLSQQPTKP